LFGFGIALVGLVYLAITVRQPLAVLAAAFTLVAYSFVYTPLKRVTTLNTLVGAIAGAMPPIIGWTASTNSLEAPAVVLFLVLFLWQVPHFLAIAWIYRDQYARARLRMLPALDRSGISTAEHMISYCLVLVAVSVVPSILGWAGTLYLASAAVLGSVFLTSVFRFAAMRSVDRARYVLQVSIGYLPLLQIALIADKMLR
jgi:protoheme IX farnesyltransferase